MLEHIADTAGVVSILPMAIDPSTRYLVPIVLVVLCAYLLAHRWMDRHGHEETVVARLVDDEREKLAGEVVKHLHSEKSYDGPAGDFPAADFFTTPTLAAEGKEDTK